MLNIEKKEYLMNGIVIALAKQLF